MVIEEMPDHEDPIAKLKAILAGLTGPARIPVLMELARLLIARFQEGRTDAAACLGAAIDCMTELHGMLEPSDQWRLNAAKALADMHLARLQQGTSVAPDTDAAVGYLEEVLQHHASTPANREEAHIKTAMALGSRVMQQLPSQDGYPRREEFPVYAARVRAEVPHLLSDMDKAQAHLAAVIDTEPVNRQLYQVAVMCHNGLSMMRTMLDMFGPDGGFDPVKLTQLWGSGARSLLQGAPGRPDASAMRGWLQGANDASAQPQQHEAATPPRRAVTAEVAALHRYADRIRRASGPEVLDIAWEAAGEAAWAAEYCLAEGRPADAIELLELGRALLLHAATGAEIPGAAPDAADIAAALRAADRQALVYLVAEHLLIVTADGAIADVGASELTASVPDPLACYDWAWTAAIQPLLSSFGTGQAPRRIVIVAPGALGRVPWHAARTRSPGGRYRYACEDLVISYAASARQWIDVAHRPAASAGGAVVFVANPGGDRDRETFDTMALRHYVYPRSIGLGVTGELAAGAGTADEVAAHLPGGDGDDVRLLHLGCQGHVDADPAESRLELAGGAALRMRRILEQSRGRRPGAPGGLVVLTDCAGAVPDDRADLAFALSSAMLAAGATGVVEAGWPHVTPARSPLLTVFHHLLAHKGLAPADALRQAQLWLLDPDRIALDGVVVDAGADLADPVRWAGVRHHGQ